MMHLFCNYVCLVILAFEHILTSSLTHIHVILQNPSTESMGVCHTPKAMFRSRNMHSWECCHYFYKINVTITMAFHKFIHCQHGQEHLVFYNLF